MCIRDRRRSQLQGKPYDGCNKQADYSPVWEDKWPLNGKGVRSDHATGFRFYAGQIYQGKKFGQIILLDDFLRNLFNLTQQAGGRYHFHLLLPTAILTAMVSGVGCRSDLMIKWYLCILFHLCLVHLTPAQVKDRYAYSESFSMKEGLKHTVVGDIKTDRNDLLWIAVDGTLQLFDGDQFIDMSHLIHESNSSRCV